MAKYIDLKKGIATTATKKKDPAPTPASSTSSNKTSTNSDYKIVSQWGKGIATGDAAKINDANLNNADFRESEKLRAQQVIIDRANAGEDTSAQQAYLARLKAYDANKVVDPKQTLIDLSIANEAKQNAALRDASDASYRANVAGIEGSYESARSDQERVKGDVNEQYEDNLQAVDANRYMESEQSKVVGEQRGIGSSAQFDAMQRGTISRAGKMKLSAAQDRNKALSDISQRIASLGLQKNLAINAAGAQRDLTVATGQMQNAQSAFQNQYGLELGDFEFQRGATEADRVRLEQQEYATGEREATQNWQSSEANTSREFQAYMQERGFSHDITMFDKNSSLQKWMQSSSQAHASAMVDKNFAKQKEAEAYNYALDINRKLALTNPNSDESKAMRGVLQVQREELNTKKAIDFTWAVKGAQFESELARTNLKVQQEDQLKSLQPGSTAYNIAMAQHAIQNKQYLSSVKNEIAGQYVGTAMEKQLQSKLGSNYPSFDQQLINGLTKFVVDKATKEGSGFNKMTVDELTKRGVLLPGKDYYDEKAVFDGLRDWGIVDDKFMKDLFPR